MLVPNYEIEFECHQSHCSGVGPEPTTDRPRRSRTSAYAYSNYSELLEREAKRELSARRVVCRRFEAAAETLPERSGERGVHSIAVCSTQI